MPKAYREVFTIIRGAGVEGKDKWVRVGTSWTNRDGSEDVLLYALPVNGKLQLRTPKPKEKAEERL